MMHKYLLSVLFASLLFACLTTAHAQTRPRQTPTRPATKQPAPKPDLLVRLDGTQLDVLVTEITDKEIVYKRASNPSGPNFRVLKADFSFIKYGNDGEIERFAKVEQPAPAPVKVEQPAPAPVQPTPAQAVQTRTTSNAPAYQSQPASSPKKFRLGLLAGGQSATMNFDGSIDGQRIFGFRGGLLSDRSVGNAGCFRTQILYSSKGTNLIKGDLNLNYLEVPFDFLYKIQTPNAQFLLGGGGYFGKLLNAKLWSADAAQIFTSTDAGVRVSGWVDLPSGLTLNVFYNLGLLDVNSGLTSFSSISKNRTFGFGIGYFLLNK